MTALTEAHLDKLNDEDLRAIALRLLNDAVSALDTSIEEHDLANHPDLDTTPIREAADWLRKVLANPGNGYSDDMLVRHSSAVHAFHNTAYGVGESTTGSGLSFPPYRNADAVDTIFYSVFHDRGTPHRPSAHWLRIALGGSGGEFIPGHETPVGYVLNVICDSDDPRLPALAESYMQSGLQANFQPAINRAAKQLVSIDELTELNH